TPRPAAHRPNSCAPVAAKFSACHSSSSEMSNSSMVANRSPTMRRTMALRRGSPLTVSAPLSLSSRAWTSAVSIRRSVISFPLCMFCVWGVPTASTVVLMNRRRVPAQRRDLDVHEGKQRQGADDVVQFLHVRHVEDAEVRILAGEAPQVPPLALTLQLLGALALDALQFGGAVGVEIDGDADIHAD